MFSELPFLSSCPPHTHVRAHDGSSAQMKCFSHQSITGARALLSNYALLLHCNYHLQEERSLTGLSPSPPGSGWDTCQTPVSSRAYRASGLPFRSDIAEALLHGAGPGVRQCTSTQLQGRWVALRRPPPPAKRAFSFTTWILGRRGPP